MGIRFLIAMAIRSVWRTAAGLSAAQLARAGKASAQSVVDNLRLVRRFVVELTLIGIVGVGLYGLSREMFRGALVVFPVSAPPALAERGYTPEAMSQRIAREMNRIQTTTMTVLPRSQVTASQASVVAEELADIPIPGQEMSFRTVVGFIKDALGLRDVGLNVNISVDEKAYEAQIGVLGGPYHGTTESLRLPATMPVEALAFNIAVKAVAAAQPYLYAAYVMTVPKEHCPQVVSCTSDEARRVFHSLLTNSVEDDDSWAHFGWSAVSLMNDEHDDALRHCQAAIDIDEELAGAYVNCAYALTARKRRDEALDYLRRATRLRPRDPDVNAALGDVYLELGAAREALERYQAAVDVNANHFYSHIGLGTASRRLKEFPEAAAWYEKALLIAPNEAYAHGGLGLALIADGKKPEAIPHLQTALQLRPDYQLAYETLVRTLDELGRHEEARQAEQRWEAQAAKATTDDFQLLTAFAE